ncbi:helix-turn-helix domain-containing protein [Variovorax sp. J22R115]|uniref:helix-turn-helix domain-containing protein n=1 Tax=Variovorax sp. J22R115 TaxID=3053509 RepID=UPI0034DF8171
MIDEGSLYLRLGERVRALRTQASDDGARMTQARLAELVGLERTSITNIEKGMQKVPLHVLYRICEALRVSPAYLLPPISELATTPTGSSLDVRSIAEAWTTSGHPLLGQALEKTLTNPERKDDVSHS